MAPPSSDPGQNVDTSWNYDTINYYHHFYYLNFSFSTLTQSFLNLKFYKFCDFSGDIDYISKIEVFMDVIYLIINLYRPRLPKGPSGGQKVSACRAAQESEAGLYYIKDIPNFIHYEVRLPI